MKPRIKEYLMSPGEESTNDTLFYIRHARRFGTPADSISQADKETMVEELESAFIALGF